MNIGHNMETYARILETGNLQYFTPTHGGLVLGDQLIINASEEQYNQAGWYKINQIADDGENYLDGNIIQYYIGKPNEIDIIKAKLDSTPELIEALERLIAANGVTEEDRNLAQERLQLRDSLAKLLQTTTGDGSAWDPYTWNEGEPVTEGCWYRTPGNYLWEAIASGIPASELDTNYFDVI